MPLALLTAPEAELITDDATAALQASMAQSIRFLRSQRGMTRKQLTQHSGVSLPHLARIEGGRAMSRYWCWRNLLGRSISP